MTTSTTKSTKSTKTTKTTAPKTTARKSTARSASGTRKVAAQASSAAQSVVDKAAAAAKSFPGLDVSKLDPRKLDLSAVDADKLATAMRDAAYTVVGFGVLAAQKANVRRREMAARIGARFGANSTQVEEAIKAFETRLG
ncbi:MAG: hypothetical protein ABIQ39_03640, partial [Ilumatobacteraceae bacterium]